MKWTLKEDRMIAEAIVSTNNKSIAFEKISNQLGVSKKAVESRYYRNKKEIEMLILEAIKLNEYFSENNIPWYKKLWKVIRNMLNLN